LQAKGAKPSKRAKVSLRTLRFSANAASSSPAIFPVSSLFKVILYQFLEECYNKSNEEAYQIMPGR
jgi:hypothetical protein